MNRFLRWAVVPFLLLIALISFVPASAAQDDPLPQSRYWATGPVLNQGPAPECVGYSLESILDSTDFQGISYLNYAHPSAHTIYVEAQKRDPWSSQEHDGTSLEAGIDYLIETGYIDAAATTTDVTVMRDYILTKGPIEMGTIWTYSMLAVDSTGLVSTGNSTFPAGSHAYECYGFDVSTDSFWCQNSWGTNWGVGGRFRISLSDMRTLMTDWAENNGEAMLPHVSFLRWLQIAHPVW